MTTEEIFDHMTTIANLVIGIMDRGVPFDEALERAVAYHLEMVRAN